MTKQTIRSTENVDWVSKNDGKTIEDAIQFLESMQDKYGPRAELATDCYGESSSYGYVVVEREETDAEYKARILRETRLQENLINEEKRNFAILYKKYGEPEKPKYLSFADWYKIAEPVYAPMRQAFGNDCVIDNFLSKKYKEYVEAMKDV
jgi:hypothetical protein